MLHFSLLWPGESTIESPGLTTVLAEETIRDLGLSTTIEMISPGMKYRGALQKILFNICLDPAVINYRQDILEDLVSQPELTACLNELLPEITHLEGHLDRKTYGTQREKPSLYQLVNRLMELKVFVACIDRLGTVLAPLRGKLRSDGLKHLDAFVEETESNPVFQNLKIELPKFLSEIENHASITIGINLDSTLQPVAATLVSVNSRRYTNAKLLNKLVGPNLKMLEGIAELHTLANYGVSEGGPIDLMMVPLFRDLEKVLAKVTRSFIQALDQYTDFNSELLIVLKHEVVFYLAALKTIEYLQGRGLPMCRPELAPAEERCCLIKNNYNLNLALNYVFDTEDEQLSQVVIQNDVDSGATSRTLILTGPNQGGKTTFLQSVGLTQVLAQAGFFVPGTQARISPVDGIFTHYPLEENLEKGTGRFGDEAKRLHEILARMTRFSLVLLNETLSSTSPGESLYLAQDVVRVMLKIGARTIFSTHLHELAAGLDKLNAEIDGDSQAASLVASFVENMDEKILSETPIKRSYKVTFSPPMGHSCARELAAHYRISYEQISEMLKERGVLPE
jgi:DNA mismatch repair protein MutS